MAERNPPKKPNFFGPAFYIWDNIFPQDKDQNKAPNSSATQNQHQHPTSDLDNIVEENDAKIE